MNNLLYGDISQKIIGCALEVHSYLGCGFLEVVYQRALALEMTRAGLHFLRETDQNIYYKDYPDEIGFRRADFIVEGKILVETKAIAELDNGHISQILNCLKVHHTEVGLLLNFGGRSLDFKRFVLSLPSTQKYPGS